LAPEPKSPGENKDIPNLGAAASSDEQRYVLHELIILLIRKQVLTDGEGQALLDRLLRSLRREQWMVRVANGSVTTARLAHKLAGIPFRKYREKTTRNGPWRSS
jgi:hypothetical protein